MEAQNTTTAGPWAGHHQSFVAIAGYCSAEQARCLKKARDSRAFDSVGLTWDQYAKHHFGISRASADQLIRLLDRFGETYFQISQIARIGPATYRRFAQAVHQGRLHFAGEQLEIAPENAPRIRAAVRALRAEWRQSHPRATPALPDPPAPQAAPPPPPAPPTQSPAQVLDAWHQAAATGDRRGFFQHFAEDAYIVGAAPAERWTATDFACWAARYWFFNGLWDLHPYSRTLNFSPDGAVAWFHELLDPDRIDRSCGSGVLVLRKGVWKIHQYAFTTPFPPSFLSDLRDEPVRQ